MSEQYIKAKEKIGMATYEAVWDIYSGRLRISCDAILVRDWPFSQAHAAVTRAIGGSYVSAAPSEVQLLGVIRYYAGK